jgi:hypothetical protein
MGHVDAVYAQETAFAGLYLPAAQAVQEVAPAAL